MWKLLYQVPYDTSRSAGTYQVVYKRFGTRTLLDWWPGPAYLGSGSTRLRVRGKPEGGGGGVYNGERPTYEDVIDEELDKVENHQDGEEGVQMDIEGETPLHILQMKWKLSNYRKTKEMSGNVKDR